MGEPAAARSVALSAVHRFTGDSAVFDRVAATKPWLTHEVDRYADLQPVPPTVAPFDAGAFCRPANSYRCFYFSPAADGEESWAPGSGVVAFKGLEPLADDFCDRLADFRRSGPSPHNIAEHFVHEEHKVPGCVLLPDALLEAERASSYQAAHLAAYGEPAHAPVPLFVFRHPDDVVARTAEVLRLHLSVAAFRIVERELDRGLGAYVYYYPSLPVRARDVDFLLQTLPFRERLLALMGDGCDPGAVIEGWVRGFVRMLYCGFLPGSLASLRTGVCCQPQNACIDGGFVDLDSLTRFDELVDDAAVFAALQFSVDSLLDSVSTLVAGRIDPARGDASDVRIDMHYFREHVLAQLRAAVERESRPGLELDARVHTYLSPPTEFAALFERIRPYYP